VDSLIFDGLLEMAAERIGAHHNTSAFKASQW
jgi:hypothetical protein